MHIVRVLHWTLHIVVLNFYQSDQHTGTNKLDYLLWYRHELKKKRKQEPRNQCLPSTLSNDNAITVICVCPTSSLVYPIFSCRFFVKFSSMTQTLFSAMNLSWIHSNHKLINLKNNLKNNIVFLDFHIYYFFLLPLMLRS